MTKLKIRFHAIAHLQRAHITAGSENVPDSQSYVYIFKYEHLKRFI